MPKRRKAEDSNQQRFGCPVCGKTFDAGELYGTVPCPACNASPSDRLIAKADNFLTHHAQEDHERTKHLPNYIPAPTRNQYAATWRRLSQNFRDPSDEKRCFSDKQIRRFVNQQVKVIVAINRNSKRNLRSPHPPGFVIDSVSFFADIDFLAHIDWAATSPPAKCLKEIAGDDAAKGYGLKEAQSTGGEATRARYDAAREFARMVASNSWKEPPNEKIGKMAEYTTECINNNLSKVGLSKAVSSETVKNWIKDLAPPEARVPGRPRKN